MVGGPSAISVIIPTCGRQSLRRTLISASKQLLPVDEILVIADAEDEQSCRIFHESGLVGQCVIDPTPGEPCWGYKARAFGISIAHNGWIHVMGDDDIYLPSAFAKIRSAIGALATPIPLMFKMFRRSSRRRVLWRTKTLRCGNVAGELFVFPNDPSRIGSFSSQCGYVADFHFIVETVNYYGGQLEWVDRPIVVWRA